MSRINLEESHQALVTPQPEGCHAPTHTPLRDDDLLRSDDRARAVGFVVGSCLPEPDRCTAGADLGNKSDVP